MLKKSPAVDEQLYDTILETYHRELMIKKSPAADEQLLIGSRALLNHQLPVICLKDGILKK